MTLSGCKANKGGGRTGSLNVTSVKLTLYKNGSPAGSVTHKCGAYNFGNPGAGNFSFKVTAINGNTNANRSTFLDASTVSVKY